MINSWADAAKISTEQLVASVDQDMAVVALSPLWEAADILPAYPAASATVAELLNVGGGYDVTPEMLTGWARVGTIPEVLFRGGRFHWGAVQIEIVRRYCETFRFFKPLDRRHLHKLSAIQIEEMKANEAGKTSFADLDAIDTRSLVTMLELSGDAAVRNYFATALMTKLRKAGAVR